MTLVESASADEKWLSGMEHWTMTMFSHQGKWVNLNLVGPWYGGLAKHVSLFFSHGGKTAIPGDGIRTMSELDLLGCPEGSVLIWDEIGV